MCLLFFVLPPTESLWQNAEPPTWFYFQPTSIPAAGSSGLTPSGSREDSSLLNEGFLQAKSEKPAAPKSRGHFPTPAPVSAAPRGLTLRSPHHRAFALALPLHDALLWFC